MKDPFVRGAIAGMIGQVGISLVTVPSRYLFHFSKHIWAEYVSVIIFGHSPGSVWEWVLAWATLLVFAAVVGGAFPLIVALFPERRNYLARGIGWAYAVWIATFGIGTISKMPLFLRRDWATDLAQFVGITVFGLIAGLLAQRWDKVYGYPEPLVSLSTSSPESLDRLVGEFRRIEDILERIDERLDPRPGESPDGERETGWDHVEHLGFRVLKPSEDDDR